LLQSKLKHKDDETWTMLVADSGPLRSFYTKIAMGYALGIYDKNIRSDLNIVRTIRNAFAHSKKLIQFDHPAVVAELRKATRLTLPKKSWKYKANASVMLVP
jgi:DNA-binding MltR family transcriptional regulator